MPARCLKATVFLKRVTHRIALEPAESGAHPHYREPSA